MANTKQQATDWALYAISSSEFLLMMISLAKLNLKPTQQDNVCCSADQLPCRAEMVPVSARLIVIYGAQPAVPVSGR